ncbi:DUF6494 family protein [Pontibaca methylaminivorans]|uniref:Uncharacterized protein n=1 Tax=Pontibaca methylaminivorans TaxID=515897 RepID=A0A1R3WXI9_9RHOB|nr:DUF6494 family protein [Pontibaca methylaminivorans]SIT83259.1 hypothetical protein SAMN05421849_1874 [Pontibaca methylaminivorans]
MSEEDFNMSMRKFLKKVGVTSQQEIEKALREAESNGKDYEARMVLTIDELGLRHEITGKITSAN